MAGIDDSGPQVRRDEKLRGMLRDLGRALSEAISDSSEVSRTLRKIRQEGYSLHLLLDCKRRDPEDDEDLPVKKAKVPSKASARATGKDPEFRIDARDLSFLRSIGIDPTRRLRRRRS